MVVLLLAGCAERSPGPPAPTAATLPAPVGLAAPVVRHPGTGDVMYFVVPDRFRNGDTANDHGGLDPGAGPGVHGFLPDGPGYFHGGDLAGLEASLDHLRGLGVTVIWITPPFVTMPTLGDGPGTGSAAGHLGSWPVDFTHVDPHLGTDAEMVSFVSAAHDLGMKVFMDAIANHTGDLIRHREAATPYRWKETDPYLDAAGIPFDPAHLTGAFPRLDPEVSFPYVPVFRAEGDAARKRPAWLNDVTLYHNRGESLDDPEALTYGDLDGLDDLFTEHPRVVEGMIEIHADAIRRYGIDGFRVDAVRHVDDAFWRAWVPAIDAAAVQAGRDGFFVFGSGTGADPDANARYSTALGFHGMLDLRFSEAVLGFAVSDSPSRVLSRHFSDDDLYTDADSNASMLVKLVGTHDTGRLGHLLRLVHPGASDDELVARMRLAFALLHLTRGMPAITYGDEQGFAGDGDDAHPDILPTAVASSMDDDLIGTDATPADLNLDATHPLYRTLAELATLRAAHPALSAGAQVERYSNAKAGVYAFSRIHREERVEYVVATNNAPDERTVTFDTYSPTTWFHVIWGGEDRVRTLQSGALRLTVPGRSTVVLRAEKEALRVRAPTLTIVKPGGIADPRVEFQVEPTAAGYFEVTFATSVDGAAFSAIGTDDNPPYRVHWLPPGEFTSITVMATLDDLVGGRAVVEWEVTAGG